jgi:hypothetical protein
MAPPKKRKQQADTTKTASEDPQEAPEPVSKRTKIHKTTKAPPTKIFFTKVITNNKIPKQLRQDFHNKPEGEESEYKSKNSIINEL